MSAEKKYAINVTLFKIIGFYQMLDPNGKTLFGRNLFSCINVTCIIFTSTVTLIGLSGFIFKTKVSRGFGFQDLQMSFYLACITMGNLKLSIVITNAKKLWGLFSVAHESFLSSKYCKQNYFKIANRGKEFSRTFHWYFFLFFMTAFSWVILPKIIDLRIATEETNTNENTHKLNVVNLRFPINAKAYNTHYNIVYALESVICSYGAYGLVTFDLFLIALIQLIIVQYEIVSSAYENLEIRVKDEKGHNIFNSEKIKHDIVSITEDCQNIHKQLEIIYGLSRPIVLTYMVADAIGMITLPYLIVMFYVQNGSLIINFEVLTFVWTLFVVGVQSYIFSSLFQLISEKKEAVQYGLYSCDWAWSDIRIKKLLLLTMIMNRSYNLKMNATPTKYIDLPMLASIVRSSYSVTSVMINSYFRKSKSY